jgi:hypothetical protein
MGTILVVNAGSSSVKFQVFTLERSGELTRKIKGSDGRHRHAAAAGGSGLVRLCHQHHAAPFVDRVILQKKSDVGRSIIMHLAETGMSSAACPLKNCNAPARCAQTDNGLFVSRHGLLRQPTGRKRHKNP